MGRVSDEKLYYYPVFLALLWVHANRGVLVNLYDLCDLSHLVNRAHLSLLMRNKLNQFKLRRIHMTYKHLLLESPTFRSSLSWMAAWALRSRDSWTVFFRIGTELLDCHHLQFNTII